MDAKSVIEIATRVFNDDLEQCKNLMDNPTTSNEARGYYRGREAGLNRAVEVLRILNGGKEVSKLAT
jgi:hypothetical protein